jgi:hypothetical protein
MRLRVAWRQSGQEAATYWREPPVVERTAWLLGLVTGRLAAQFADGWRAGIGMSPIGDHEPDLPEV